VVIQEHPTEPRFGLDVGTDLGTASHLVIGANPPPGVVPPPECRWGANAAHMAGITRRLPVRAAIHASRLVAQTAPPSPRERAGLVTPLSVDAAIAGGTR
jgi:hypothetical protein